MTTFYYCPECDETMPERDTSTDVDYVTSEFWGARSTQRQEFIVCGCCGGDVEEVPEPDLNLDDPEEECEA